MAETIKLSIHIPTKANKIYDSWLDSQKHSQMIGGKAKAQPKEGVKFSAFDGYITGTNLELIRNKRIIQSWRTTEFSKHDLNSILVVKLEETEKGTKVSLIHSEIPDGQGASYKAGWKEYYFTPMKEYFAKK